MRQVHYLFVSQNTVFETIYLRFVRIVVGIIGATFLILLFGKIFNSDSWKDRIYKHNLVLNVGKETLGIYILQDIIIMGLFSKYVRIGFCSEFVFSVVITPVFSIIILFICYQLVMLIKKSDKLALYFLSVQ